jgi:3-dehydroquinate synthase
MVMEARLAENLKIASKNLSVKIAKILSSFGLPIRLPKDVSKEKLIHSMQYDKKKTSGVIRFTLPVEIGEVCVNVEVKDLDLLFKEN